MHWYTYVDAEKAAAACARHILTKLEQALGGSATATLAVSGGSTPRLMFAELARARFDWKQVQVFFVDERMVPPDHPESNYRLALEHFLKPARVPAANVHRIEGELRPDLAAEAYQQDIESFFDLRAGALPKFDVIHLGLGGDAHTASLFPGDAQLDNREGIAAAVFIEKLSKWRVTLLPGVLLNARHLAMLVAGEDKAEAVKQVLEGPYDPRRYPAQIVSHHAREVSWFVDAAAAALHAV